MIGRLCGHIVAESPEGGLVIDVNGVGYELLVPLGTLGRTARDSEGRVTLHVHTALRQDALELFGFASEHERRVYRLLINVPNVGPKTAVNLLGAIPPSELATVVKNGDLARLGKVSGIGKKTAERLLLELKSKVAQLQTPGQTEVDPGSVAPPTTMDVQGRVALALTSMGFKLAEAQAAVRSLGDELTDRPVSELVREALARLSR
jgi:Holliday junction DNA helicase RuvA